MVVASGMLNEVILLMSLVHRAVVCCDEWTCVAKCPSDGPDVAVVFCLTAFVGDRRCLGSMRRLEDGW